MSDRLALANAIADAGIPRDKAERVASVIIDAIHDNVATKGDLDAVRADMKADIRFLRWQVGMLYVPVLAILVKLLHG